MSLVTEFLFLWKDWESLVMGDEESEKARIEYLDELVAICSRM